jgi:2-hydroxy-6-oxo-6-(2'-aminophenyl)hexa-2,4-dienoate hydrolase
MATSMASLQSQSQSDWPLRFLETGSIKTAYYRAGKGPPLVLIHGGGAGADSYGNWRSCIDELAGHFDTIAVDLVGFGNSSKPDAQKFSYDQAARTKQLEEFILELGVGPTYIVGNSMGGLTSLDLSVARPDLVKAQILMGSAAIRTPTNPALQSILNYDFTLEGMRKIVQGLTDDSFELDPALVQYRYELSIKPDVRAGYLATQNWIRERGGLYCDEELLQQIKVPTLIVSGKNDKVVPVTSAYRMLELIPHSWGAIFPRCGHWAMIEHPSHFCRTVVRFLGDLNS